MSERPDPLQNTIAQLRSAMDDNADDAGASGGDAEVSVGVLLDALEAQSLGVVLAIMGLLQITPVGSIPGFPNVVALVVIITAGHSLVGGRTRFWAPGILRRRTFRRSTLEGALKRIEPAARFIDNGISRRLSWLIDTRPARIAIVLACVVLAAALVGLSFVPFGGLPAAAGLILFGLALIAGDGLLALLGYVVVVGASVGAGALLF